MGGEDSGNDDSISGSEEAGSRNIVWFTEEGNKEQADGDDVNTLDHPPIEDSQFEAANEDLM
jgi:hypothetical protein